MAQTNMNIRIDEDLKKQADSLFNDLGLNMSSAVNVFVRQAVREGRIPFEITTKVEEREKAIERLLSEIQKGEQSELLSVDEGKWSL